MPDRHAISSLAVGDQVDEIYRLKHLVSRQTPQGKGFLLGELEDASGRIGFVWWQVSESQQRQLQDACYLRVGAKVDRHRDRLQLVLHRAETVAEAAIDPVWFHPAQDLDVAALWQELEERIASLADDHLRALLQAVFADPQRAEAFRHAPAGVTLHHAYTHGLLEHTVAVTRLAEDCCQRYAGLDRSLLVAGAILHDFDKVSELAWTGQLSYTVRGNLVGHLVGGAILVERLAAELPDFPARTRDKLQHLILSHHGELAHGAAREPLLKEAVILHLIDNLDSRIAGFEQAVAQSTSTDPDWTEPNRMFGRRLYRGE